MREAARTRGYRMVRTVAKRLHNKNVKVQIIIIIIIMIIIIIIIIIHYTSERSG